MLKIGHQSVDILSTHLAILVIYWQELNLRYKLDISPWTFLVLIWLSWIYTRDWTLVCRVRRPSDIICSSGDYLESVQDICPTRPVSSDRELKNRRGRSVGIALLRGETTRIHYPLSMPIVKRPEVTCYRIWLQLERRWFYDADII